MDCIPYDNKYELVYKNVQLVDDSRKKYKSLEDWILTNNYDTKLFRDNLKTAYDHQLVLRDVGIKDETIDSNKWRGCQARVLFIELSEFEEPILVDVTTLEILKTTKVTELCGQLAKHFKLIRTTDVFTSREIGQFDNIKIINCRFDTTTNSILLLEDLTESYLPYKQQKCVDCLPRIIGDAGNFIILVLFVFDPNAGFVTKPKFCSIL